MQPLHTGDNPFESVVPYLLYLPLALVAVAIVVFVIIMIRKNIKQNSNDYADDNSISATVFSKRTRKKRDPNTLPYDKEYQYAATMFYYITFETHNCQRIELSVDAATYKRLSEGEIGTLTYQGSQYIDFIQGNF